MNLDNVVELGNYIIHSASGLWHQLIGYAAVLAGPVGLQLVISLVTIWMTLMAGNKHPKAWLIGLANQALWITLIVWIQAWGLVPLCVAMCVVYYRNHTKWKADQLIQKINEMASRCFAFDTRDQFPTIGQTGALYKDRSTGVSYIWVNTGYQVL